MNKLSFTKILVIAAVMLSPLFAKAQNNEVRENKESSHNDYFYVTGDLGLGLLGGDNTTFKLGMNGHLGLGYQVDNFIGFKANIGYGGLNAGFENVTIDKLNYFEANFNLMLDLTNVILGYNPDRKFSAIPHVGLGQLQYRINALDNEGNVYYQGGYKENNEQDSGIDGRKVVATIPMGLELNYQLNPNWKLYLYLTANYVDSDWLDGVNGNYRNDWFYAVNLGANYKLGGSLSKIFQSSEEYCNYWFLTIDGGASFLFGDNPFNFSIMKSNFNIGGGYNFHNFYRLYVKAGKGEYTGQGKDNEFVITDASYYNASVNLSADLVGLIFGYDEARKVTLYPHVGIGQTQYRATTYVPGEGTEQVGYNNDNAYNTTGDGINGRRVALTFPLGIELVYNVSENADIYADATSYLTQTDMLDCMNLSDKNDSYSTVNIGLRYKFNRTCTTPQEDKCLTPDEVKEAIKEAIEQQAEEEKAKEEPKACITPEDLKQAIKDAIQEYEASRPKQESVLSPATVINNNFSDISFPKNGAQKVKTQTNIDALNRASNQVTNGSAVNRIIVEGYASPEGSNDFNEKLALQRAEQAVEIIKKELGEIEAERIEITNKGADWDGLMTAIAASDIENSEEIIDEIKNSSNREETLKGLMEQNPQIRQLLPQLRRASVVITTVK